MILQIHDELVRSRPRRASQAPAAVLARMQNAVQLSVPLVVHVGSGPNWLAAH
jgi:DNA polymerase-1